MRIPEFAIPLIVAFIIQFIKVIIDFVNEKKIKVDSVWRAWWFPSVHSGISSSIATLIFFRYGVYSPEFTICIIFSMLFWYDAMNVRYEAGKHAQEINKIKLWLRHMLKTKDSEFSLTERLGHTFVEVVWWIIIWACLTIILYYIFLNVNLGIYI